MHQLRSVLRSLILICLSGWLGIVAQPAEAQQTVTLSGRVTDAAGQAVSGATVNLEDPGWVGQETDANGNYRLSVPPGTYRVRVRPLRGPLISQKIEGLRLSTNTTRNFVLEAGGNAVGAGDRSRRPVRVCGVAVGRERRRPGGQFQCRKRIRSLQPGGADWNLPGQRV